MRRYIIFLLLTHLVLATARLSANITSLVPSEGKWIAITAKGLVILDTLPNGTSLNLVVKRVCNDPYINIYIPTNLPWACRVEALSLLKKPSPAVFWNATPSKNITCGGRYLFAQLLSSKSKGPGVTVIYPLDNSICKRVTVNSFLKNNTLVISINIKKIKPWLDICPPSKIYDVIIAWGNAKAVRVIINGKTVLEERSP